MKRQGARYSRALYKDVVRSLTIALHLSCRKYPEYNVCQGMCRRCVMEVSKMTIRQQTRKRREPREYRWHQTNASLVEIDRTNEYFAALLPVVETSRLA